MAKSDADSKWWRYTLNVDSMRQTLITELPGHANFPSNIEMIIMFLQDRDGQILSNGEVKQLQEQITNVLVQFHNMSAQDAAPIVKKTGGKLAWVILQNNSGTKSDQQNQSYSGRKRAISQVNTSHVTPSNVSGSVQQVLGRSPPHKIRRLNDNLPDERSLYQNNMVIQPQQAPASGYRYVLYLFIFESFNLHFIELHATFILLTVSLRGSSHTALTTKPAPMTLREKKQNQPATQIITWLQRLYPLSITVPLLFQIPTILLQHK